MPVTARTPNSVRAAAVIAMAVNAGNVPTLQKTVARRYQPDSLSTQNAWLMARTRLPPRLRSLQALSSPQAVVLSQMRRQPSNHAVK